MRVGGNDQCINFLKNYGIAKTTPISQKYNTPAAMLYRDRIDAAANGRPLPTELPAPEGSGSGGGGGSGGINSSDSNPAQGVEPLEGESEAQYVARQRRLQEEARERMRKKLSGTGGGSMAGIGSDPNYVPGGGGGYGTGGGDGSAFSFVSSWVDQVSKSTQQLLQENNLTGGGGGGGGGNSTNTTSSNNGGGGGSRSGANGNGSGSEADPWAAITTGAVGLWAKATEATNELVKNITKPEDDDGEFHFPRPDEIERQRQEEEAAFRFPRADEINSTGYGGG
eukprot:CAMPEP_0174969868 /NCGR_PEP_ID=MMETSP0004_2-20121128/9023_1 /TAXON_ID=420556 /ORGANISM="Ochromonas sp., Strain CCMP1393" /LENGTH=281 /DNA_ID=CAMNT_0016219449 /DNA_START=400 /DNA_END=1242 /DNA_ORIENTATION=+